LLSRLTLEEKAAQMTRVWQKKSETLTDAEGNFDLKKAKAAFKNGHGLGQVARPTDAGKGKDARSMAELTYAIRKFFMENSRLGIPVTFHEECLHGHAGVGSTSFPQPIGLAATFNPDLAAKLYAMTAGGTAPAVQMNSLMRFSRNSWRPLTLGVTSPFLSM
jgi:beta-glucosidase